MMLLSNKNVLITGAAGRIGTATARLALKMGASVIISDIDSKRLTDLALQLSPQYKDKVFPIKSDVTSEEDIELLINHAIDCAGHISCAVHSAYPVSAGWGTPFGKLKAKYLNQDLSMQLGSAILFSQAILSYFQANGGGDLVHISSIQGISAPKFEHYQGTEMTSPVEYATIKAGIISMTRWLAKYYAHKGIRVNCISPGGILDQQPAIFLERYRQSCTNIGMLSGENVARTIIFLLSDDANAINGQNIIVDDGWSL